MRTQAAARTGQRPRGAFDSFNRLREAAAQSPLARMPRAEIAKIIKKARAGRVRAGHR